MTARDIVMAAAGASPPVGPSSVSYADTAFFNGSESNTYHIFSSVNIGSADPNRKVVVAVSNWLTGRDSSQYITSVTVAGQPTTQLVSQTSSGQVSILFITNAPVTTGTTADIKVSFTYTPSYSPLSISTYCVTNVVSNTPVATASTATNGGSVSLATQKDGFVIGYGSTEVYYGTGSSANWTGLSEDFFINGYPYPTNTGLYVTGASKLNASSGSVTASCGFSTDYYLPCFVYASMR